MSVEMTPYFVKGKAGKIFLLKFQKPQCTPASVFIIIPPFAEEMNKSRRMLSRLARELAEQGHEVILPDLYGTGDSEGDFSDASWKIWCNDVLEICQGVKANKYKLNLIAVRAGALLAYELLSKQDLDCSNLILWQPVVSGDAWLTQFLRLKLVAGMMSGAVYKETVKNLKSSLNEGCSVEVAGYTISPELANGIISVNLQDSTPVQCDKVYWMELVSSENKPLLPISKKILENWKSITKVQWETVVGQAFWSTTEIVDVDTLLLRTTSLVSTNR